MLTLGKLAKDQNTSLSFEPVAATAVFFTRLLLLDPMCEDPADATDIACWIKELIESLATNSGNTALQFKVKSIVASKKGVPLTNSLSAIYTNVYRVSVFDSVVRSL